MSAEGRDERLEELTSAWRPSQLAGGPAAHPVWHDLTDEDRLEAFRRSSIQRRIEAALDPDGLSATARAVLARIEAAGDAGA